MEMCKGTHHHFENNAPIQCSPLRLWVHWERDQKMGKELIALVGEGTRPVPNKHKTGWKPMNPMRNIQKKKKKMTVKS